MLRLTAPLPPALLVVVLLVLPAQTAPGQGRIIIEPPITGVPLPGPSRGVTLTPRSLSVEVEIVDGVAVTSLRQAFTNPYPREIEGRYCFPLPDDAGVGEFKATLNGKTLTGEVLEAEQARKTYEDIVRRTRDPALLEYLGQRVYQARLFPIPPSGRVEIALRYTQTLSETGGLGCYRYPLHAAETDTPLEQLVFHARVGSQRPLTSVFCPTHPCEIVRPGDRLAEVAYEREQVRPERDLQLYYLRSDDRFGLVLLTHREAGEPGYFLLRLSPRVELPVEQVQPKDIAFVIDTSGSMAGGKIAQVRRALRFCINSLNPDDRFNIFTFSTQVHPFREGLVPADDALRAAAVEFAGRLEATGGTNLAGALLAALEADPGDSQRPYLVVLMTDGLPTVGVTDPEPLLKEVEQQNARRVRFHILGVGGNVNTHLLDRLAELNRGTRDYCTEDEDLELKLSALAGRLSAPVLTELRLALPDLDATDLYPQKLPDLFRGGELTLVGRYGATGHKTVKLSGLTRQGEWKFSYPADFPATASGNDFLPRLWAQRKIAYLLDEIRLHGRDQELVDEVVKLALRFGIVTPYTSALIVDETQQRAARGLPGIAYRGGLGVTHKLLAENQARAGETSASGVAGVLFGKAGAPAEAVGREACLASARLAGMMQADTLDNPTASGVNLRHIGAKTFAWDGQRWVDTAWDETAPPQVIAPYSDAYFNLLRKHPRLARYFALGDNVLVVFEGQVYEVHP